MKRYTRAGGAYGYGEVFEMTPGGKLSAVHSFCAQQSSPCPDGQWPYDGVIQASDGNIYGVVPFGGVPGLGLIFRITPNGTFDDLYDFTGSDGSEPYGFLLESTRGDFYGTTGIGGSANEGTLFNLALGLGPFVNTLPVTGKIGSVIRILGTNLSRATNVSFNGVEAQFAIVRASEITATVPAGAKTGDVKVTVPSGQLTTPFPFIVQ